MKNSSNQGLNKGGLTKRVMDNWEINKEGFYDQRDTRDRILFLLKYAILAPSTHNTQPWLFSVTDKSCKIYVNQSVYLKEADRKGRYLFISLGCFLENLVIAAKYFDIYKDLNYNEDLRRRHRFGPGKEDVFVAEVFFKEVSKPKVDPSFQELFGAITERFNARGPFQDKKLPKSLLASLEDDVKDFPSLDISLISSKKKIAEIAGFTAKGMIMAHSSKAFRRELSRWVRNLFSTKKDGMSWKSMRVPAPVSFCISYLIRFLNMGPILSKLNYKSVSTAKLLCVFNAEENALDWLETGRVAERAMLRVCASDLNTSIYVAAIDFDDLRGKLKEVVGTEVQPQFLLCIGYMDFKNTRTERYDINLKEISHE